MFVITFNPTMLQHIREFAGLIQSVTGKAPTEMVIPQLRVETSEDPAAVYKWFNNAGYANFLQLQVVDEITGDEADAIRAAASTPANEEQEEEMDTGGGSLRESSAGIQ